MNFHSECPGVFVQDFQANRFAVFVIAEIDPYAYYNDKPLLLRSLAPGFKENIDQSPTIYIGGTDLSESYVDIEGLNSLIDTILEDADVMAETLKNLTADQIAGTTSFECPDGSVDHGTVPDQIEFDIVDEQGTLIETVTTDLNQRETSSCASNPVPDMVASFLNDIPDIPQGFPEGNQSLVCSLPDSVLKDSLMVATEGAISTVEDFNDLMSSLGTNFDNYTQNLIESTGIPTGSTDSDNLQEWFKDQLYQEPTSITEDMDQYYGIPLVQLDTGDSPDGSTSVILQINTKERWLLDVVNLGVEFNDPSLILRMEDPIPAGVKFIAGFITDGVTHTLVQQVLAPGYEMQYKSIRKPHHFTIKSFGCDTNQIKNLCGFIHDIYIWDWATPDDIEKIKEDFGVPVYPFGALAFYDYYTARVIHNLVHEQKGMLTPVRIGGVKGKSWNLFSDDISKRWKFMQNGYLEDFFCRRKFLDNSFTIAWYHQIDIWGQGQQYIISDDINHNYLYYDYNTFEFVIKFNNTIKRWFYLMPLRKWTQYSLRYNMINGDIIIAGIDFEDSLIEQKIFNIGTDLKFELMSMLAQYNEKYKYYTNKFECSFGMLMLFNDFREDDYLNKYYLEQRPVIKDLIPYK